MTPYQPEYRKTSPKTGGKFLLLIEKTVFKKKLNKIQF
jgi:hypothetical protein